MVGAVLSREDEFKNVLVLATVEIGDGVCDRMATSTLDVSAPGAEVVATAVVTITSLGEEVFCAAAHTKSIQMVNSRVSHIMELDRRSREIAEGWIALDGSMNF